MKKHNQIRNAHFLGTKIRNLRKRNKLTMEDLSARCMRIDLESAPSVSYISMIERGKRFPSEDMLRVIASVFQKEMAWFLDDVSDSDTSVPKKGSSHGGINGMVLEPSFLFASDILQIAIPEMLSQTGVTGRQFAHLLIRAHQERHQNRFPELERAAEDVGQKQMPISLDTVLGIVKKLGLRIEWFDKLSEAEQHSVGGQGNSFVRSYFKAPNTIYLNSKLKTQEQRLKYDLAVYIGHKLLHDADGIKSTMITGRRTSHSARDDASDANTSNALNTLDIVHAWRDFECSFFAGALLCPKVPFRRLLEKHAHEVSVAELAGVSSSLAMRRMTAVSSYPHWHYFDAYEQGKLNAVYRGNGIPLPWGNMRSVEDPCQHWAVFRILSNEANKKLMLSGTSAQISLMQVGDDYRIYCCESLVGTNLAGSREVLCTGIDLIPALEAQGQDAQQLAQDLMQMCADAGGNEVISSAALKKPLSKVANILNIAWVDRGLQQPVRLICSRRRACPRTPCCAELDWDGINLGLAGV